MNIESFQTRLASPAHEFDETRDGPGKIAGNFVTLQLRTSDGIEGIGYSGFVSLLMLKSLKEEIGRAS